MLRERIRRKITNTFGENNVKQLRDLRDKNRKHMNDKGGLV